MKSIEVSQLSTEELQQELKKTRIWLQEMLCVILGGITFDGFLLYCDAYDLDASELLMREAECCNTYPLEVDWAVAMARDIWERAGYEKDQISYSQIYSKIHGEEDYEKATGINPQSTS